MSKQKPLTELRDADIRRVDAVKGAANGTRFLIAKQGAGEAGIVSAAEVRDLLAEPEGDTYLGAAGEILKAEQTAADQNDLPDSDFAYIEPGGKKDETGKTTPRSLRHFPIQDAAHVRNALARLSASPFESKARPAVEAAARRMGIGEPAEQVAKQKENSMAASADETPAEAAGPKPPFPGAKPPFKKVRKEARAILKRARIEKRQARLAKSARKLQKRALIAQANEALPLRKGTLHALGDAHEAVLEALKNQDDPTSDTAKALQSLAGSIASAMSDHAMSEAGEGDDEMDDGMDEADAAVAKTTPVSLKKARAAAKAARLEKQAARDRIRVAKARHTLAKIGRRNSASDQQHVDAIDEHAAALGATAHQTGVAAGSMPASLTKATSDEQVAGVIELIKQAVGPLVAKDLEAIRGELTQQSEQLAKIAKTPLPGGPRVVLERDGSLVAAPDGASGLSFEQAALAKVAERYPVGSVVREELQKAAATSAIKELMVARQQY